MSEEIIEPLSNGVSKNTKTIEENGLCQVKELVSRIRSISSPDDLRVPAVAAEIKAIITEELDLRNLVSELCDCALIEREIAPVVGAVFGLISLHQVGDAKIRQILLQRLQKDYSKREELLTTDRSRFVTSAMFLGEIFYYVKSDKGAPFKVLAEPIAVYMAGIIQPHLSEDPGTDINEEMIVVAKQLLMNGSWLFILVPEKIQYVVRDISEVLIRHSLSSATKLNLLAALGELWPAINASTNPRTVHAVLAAKMGLSLKL